MYREKLGFTIYYLILKWSEEFKVTHYNAITYLSTCRLLFAGCPTSPSGCFSRNCSPHWGVARKTICSTAWVSLRLGWGPRAVSRPHRPAHPLHANRSKHSSHEPFLHTDSICKIYSSHPPKTHIFLWAALNVRSKLDEDATLKCFLYVRDIWALITREENTIDAHAVWQPSENSISHET